MALRQHISSPMTKGSCRYVLMLDNEERDGSGLLVSQYGECTTTGMRQRQRPITRLANGTEQASTASKVVHAQKIEPLTVSALNEYVITANPKITEFLCTAKVNEIHADRYRVELSVSDQTGAAVLVAFDEDMAKLPTLKLLKLCILWLGLGILPDIRTCI
ncbi:hypothetical protein F2Q70_00021579 [Brassica cretica]|uniref:Replication factor A C-terminal domain-containing protein n=1 Tax=Brassica cretica TaxID=69181 RepID=A0A8S9GSJ3_BRACR|nr:hypothetical protein F2Q70_00021579 [Brassica cretica]